MVLVEEKGKIVAFPIGSTFGEENIRKIQSNLKMFVFNALLCDEHDDCDEQVAAVKANNFKNAKKALGYDSKYEAEWGDFALFIKMLKEKDDRLSVYEKTCTQADIDQSEW